MIKDLFEHPEEWVPKLRTLIEKHSEMDETYDNCMNFQNELRNIGYDIEWYLDAIPFNLHKI